MHNPIKGEILIKINGDELPLIFSYDAIAKIEAKYDDSILSIQEDMGRIEKTYSFLEAALNGAKTFKELKKAELPPVLEITETLRSALGVAYFGGDSIADAKAEDKDTKKK